MSCTLIDYDIGSIKENNAKIESNKGRSCADAVDESVVIQFVFRVYNDKMHKRNNI